MKNINKIVNSLFTWLSILSISFLLLFCNKEKSHEVQLISNINIEEMIDKNLSDFYLLREKSDSMQTEYVFKNNLDSVSVFITIGLYPSVEDAENSVQLDFSYMSIKMIEGDIQELTIGSKYWWWSPNSSFNNVTNLVFIRQNAVFILSSHNYGDLKNIAKKIDDDILNRESYIKFED